MPITADSGQDPITVLVVDDSAVVRSGLLALLGGHDRIVVVGEGSDGEQAVDLVRRLRPDVTLLDVQMPRRGGLSAAQAISHQTRVVMLTFTDSGQVVHDAVAAGAAGYLVHGTFAAGDLIACVVAAAAGTGVFGPTALAALREGRPVEPVVRSDFGLSLRQVEIMDLVAEGKSNRDIARALFLAEKTVKNHINHIFAGLGVRTRAESVSLWLGGTSAAALRSL